MADVSSSKAVWELQRIASTAKYRLLSTGLSYSSSSYTLYKYAVTAGDILYLSLADIVISSASQPVYQWQMTSSDVPSSGTNSYLVGTPVNGPVEGFVEVPETATYLIVCQLTSSTTFKVRETLPASDDISKVKLPNEDEYEVKDKLGRQIIPFGTTDFDSTSTAFKATVEGISELRSGAVCYIFNSKVTSASGCTLNVNGLGAKPMYLTSAVASRVTTQFAANYTWMFVYNEQRVSGGCWDLIYTYNTNTTYTVFSVLTRGGSVYKAKSVVYRYEMLFQMDNTYVTPLNNVSNTTGTSKAMLTNVEFDPFGEIYYYNTTTAISADANVPTGNACYTHGTIDARYTFNCGSTLTSNASLYLKVSPQANGKVKIADSTCWTQTLPSSNDGYWYIFLGRTYSTYQFSLYPTHPVYKHNGTSIVQVLNPEWPIPTKTSELTNDSGFISDLPFTVVHSTDGDGDVFDITFIAPS